MSAKTEENGGIGGRAGGNGADAELDPGLVRARSDGRGSDHSQNQEIAADADQQADWRETEQVSEPLLLQAQRLLEAAGSLERAEATLKRAADRK